MSFNHLLDSEVPSVSLQWFCLGVVNLRDLCSEKTVLFFYPRTGQPGKDPLPNWELIPGAVGCTVQSLNYNKYLENFRQLGYQVVGVSTQKPCEQKEFAERKKILFPLLSDEKEELVKAWKLPVFNKNDEIFIKRGALIIEGGRVQKVEFPVPHPEENALTLLKWLEEDCLKTSPRLDRLSPK